MRHDMVGFVRRALDEASYRPGWLTLN